jgi:hypothetical protein
MSYLIHCVRRLPLQRVFHPPDEGLRRLSVRNRDARLCALPLHHGRPLVHCNTSHNTIITEASSATFHSRYHFPKITAVFLPKFCLLFCLLIRSTCPADRSLLDVTFLSTLDDLYEPCDSGAHFVSLSNGYGGGAFSTGVKRPRLETDHSPQSSAELKNAWNYTSTSPIRLSRIVLS